ncbi:MAG: PRK06851 family protein [Dethiobacter sp.]|jgi:ABC-type dipeptide/oligopeptide/nickel transport system ATPase component|nr:PRK06851 family protein [Dethiobacter sp.]
MKGKKRHFFAGGNTAYGFYSLFHYIPGKHREQLFIIKGGPGTGKSSLMKRIGQLMAEEGHDIELFHCSSDQDSLDGMAVPSLGFAMVDGTAPHVIDPTLPGAYDEIINLGSCWDSSLLRQQKKEIALLIQQNSSYFIQAYQYLKEAYTVMEKYRYLMADAMDYRGLTEMTARLLGNLALTLPPSDQEPCERHLFAGALTPGGLINYYPSIFQDITTLFLLTGDPGSGKSYLLEQVYNTVKRCGQDVEAYHCAFDPQKLDAVVIPSTATAFVKATYPHSFSVPPAVKEQHTVSISRYSRAEHLKRTAGERTECHDRFWQLVGKAAEFIRKAKQNHDQLEKYYIQAVDFSRVNQIGEETLGKLLTCAQHEKVV